MAKRENQAIQAALIIFVIITIGLAVTTYYFYRQTEEATKENIALETKVREGERISRELLDRLSVYKFTVGIGGVTQTAFDAAVEKLSGQDAEIKDLVAAYNGDMKTFGVGLPAEQLNYRNLPNQIITKMRTMNGQLDKANADVTLLTKEKGDIIAKTGVEVANVKKMYDDKVTEYLAARKDVTNQLTRKDEASAQLETDLASQRQQVVKTQKEMRDELAIANKLREAAERTKNLLAKKVEETRTKDFDSPDGQITWVNQTTQTVYVNLGSADGMKRSLSFGVYDRDSTAVTTDDKKGAIEIVRVMDDHLSEGRIMQASSRNLILPGDKVFSPTWKPGRKIHFALAGMMDIDGDGRDDRETVRAIISRNAGVVDAELKKNGDIEGDLTHETRYLVLGARPTEKTEANAQAGYTKMIEKAENMAVEKISVDELMDKLGWRGGESTVPLGRAIGAGEGNSKFRPRTPGATGRPRSAY